MSSNKISTGIVMILKMLIRRRIVLLLFAIVPVAFFLVVEYTTPERVIPFRLASLDEVVFLEISQKATSFIFLAVACAGFLVSFLGLNLVQKNKGIYHRLIICGYHPSAVLFSNLVALLIAISGIAIYIGLLSTIFFPVKHLHLFVFGLMLIGLVYGCYGLLVGSIIKGELEGILFIVLLANIDAGWLQNPLFYAGATNKTVITYLPAYYPSQTTIIAAFTDYSALSPVLYSLLYGLLFLLMAMILFFYNMKLNNPRS